MPLSLLSYNVFFSEIDQKSRMRAIGEIIKLNRPALIGLQEVTIDILRLLRAQEWFQYYECSIDVLNPLSSSYFVVLLSALPVLSWGKVPFENTQMGRELVFAEIDIGKKRSIFVGTSHLESLPSNAKKRQEQLQISLNALKAKSLENQNSNCIGSIFMGDTNILDMNEMIQFDARLQNFEGNKCKVELAKSNRSKCRQCNKGISKLSPRIGETVTQTVGSKSFSSDHWYHPHCFIQTRRNHLPMQLMPGFLTLPEKEQEAIEKLNRGNEKVNVSANSIGLPDFWRDLWLSVPGNSENNGLTFDGKTNGLIQNRSFQSRFDRILLSESSNCTDINVKQISLVGLHPIYENIWPSDHYGLLCTVDVNWE